jgi:hypothetical protein
MKDKNMPVPKVGDKIYVESHFYISRGSDDVTGGLATVTRVDRTYEKYGNLFVEVAEHPGHSYNWIMLAEEQEKLKKEFGNKLAYPSPDIDTPWIEPGDIVNGVVYNGPPIW